VGIAWSGNPNHINDSNRSMREADLARLGAAKNVTFYSLQKDKPVLRELKARDFAGDLHDFADTAALVENLDLVISVDTAVAHVAGALGKPVWVLLPHVPDWRWLLDRPDSPWYPGVMRLFRQRAIGEWKTVVEEVAAALGQFPCP
jgi:ADP-heptose:LPS heptosyltransferase